MASKITVQVQFKASTGDDGYFTIGYVNPALLEEENRGAAKIDTCARALNSLTTNSYVDALLVSTESINDILAE